LEITSPVRFLKGVGPKRAELFEKLGVFTVGDLLYHFPRRHLDRSRFATTRDLSEGVETSLMGRIKSPRQLRLRRGLQLFTAQLVDDHGSVTLKFWGQRYLNRILVEDAHLVVSGKPARRGGIEMTNPEFEVLGEAEEELLHTGRIVPVYPLTAGLRQRMVRALVRSALDTFLPEVEESLPAELLAARALPGLRDALRGYHYPGNLEELERSRTRLAYEELFYLQTLLALRRRKLHRERKELTFRPVPERIAALQARFGFDLTAAQERAVGEILGDMEGSTAMFRLLQGDVGSGKTAVAAHALVLAVENGYQTAFMAPTEVLAEQHFRTIVPWLDPLGIRVGLHTGSAGAVRAARLAELADGSCQVAVGTHALIQEDVAYRRLGLVVVDEQHRFGVMQRAALQWKGASPDVLVMTATPIPRTLYLASYGDLDQSILDELPSGRRAVETHRVPADRRREVWERIAREAEAGRQSFVVLPLVEESEKVDLAAATVEWERLSKKVFPHLTVGLLHGRMSGEEKERVLTRFRDGKIDVLVTTTVVEVGIDVPNATVMVVEHSDRFGLSQLHQLRGRVGRGLHASFCYLIYDGGLSAEARARLRALEETQDGFVIAERDLEIRGPGEVFGTRQHGLPSLKLADLARDRRLLVDARGDALELVSRDPDLTGEDGRIVKEVLRDRYAEAMRISEVG
jgi:ATP-dependent DNA helicase RecG